MTATTTARSPSLLASTPGTTLFVLWTTYASFYFCRVNFGPAVPAIQKELGFTAIEVGFLLGAVKVGYALGQLVNGQLTERYGARRILTTGMIGSPRISPSSRSSRKLCLRWRPACFYSATSIRTAFAGPILVCK